ncbi:hypothetical protein B0T19DRAFT_2825 [Cercophora scortea]|uniref:RGS domain-containing protein n=1 Tax=Cercophora scortea TaxID=314031 RepID=A0AAE0MJT8_9PEZI|nr:hypothetical protein B0T19DRAFT_2825 [Cercophora scortea]
MFLPQPLTSRAAGSEFGTTPETKPEARVDGVAIWWLTFAAVWTAILASAMVFLHRKRDKPALRMRSLPLTFAGIVLLHLYWISVQIGYTIGPLAPEVAEFWIMSVWYPFGIALFQASNSQFLHVAKAQARFADPPNEIKTRYSEKKLLDLQQTTRKPGWIASLRGMDYAKRMFLSVTIGMTVQLVVVVVIYMLSRKFHPTFGIPGTEVYGTPMEISMQQGRGWEWWPSLFWQFLWAWVIAPIILWRSRKIHDTHGWQLQTIACCIAGLPAAPMWLISLYVPAMSAVNLYFIPPQWIAISIFVIEIFTILLPTHQVLKDQRLESSIAAIRQQWSHATPLKNFHDIPTTLSQTTTTTTLAGTPSSRPTSTPPSPSRKPSTAHEDSILTMSALEHVLSQDPSSLREFSARRDFSGENIGFLTAVSTWKTSLPPSFLRSGHDAAPEVVRRAFTDALRIHVEFVSPSAAEFPINIAGHASRRLEAVFAHAARQMFGAKVGGRDAVTPFAEVRWGGGASGTGSQVSIVPARAPSPELDAGSLKVPGIETFAMTTTGRQEEEGDGVLLYDGPIPQGFDASIFDQAYEDIKYLVLTNTWPKYVRERRASEDSTRSRETVQSDGTARSGGSRSLRKALAFLRPMVR